MKVRLLILLVGVVIGAVGVYLYSDYFLFKVPFDRNADGSTDTQYLYRQSGVLKELRMDRNHDGEIDYKGNFDQNGLPVKEFSDDDFDGRFDTVMHYRFGLPGKSSSDFDNDGSDDLRIYYENGVLEKIELYEDGRLIKSNALDK